MNISTNKKKTFRVGAINCINFLNFQQKHKVSFSLYTNKKELRIKSSIQDKRSRRTSKISEKNFFGKKNKRQNFEKYSAKNKITAVQISRRDKSQQKWRQQGLDLNFWFLIKNSKKFLKIL